MKTTTKYSPEFRERAVRMVFEHQGEHKTQWAAIVSIATKIYLRATSQASNVQTEIFLTNKTSRSVAQGRPCVNGFGKLSVTRANAPG